MNNHGSWHRANQRAGSSLIEIMVVMSVSSTLLVLTIGWIHQSMTIHQTLRRQQTQHRRLIDWSRRFRDDVRQNNQLAATGDRQWTLSAGDAASSTIIYRVDGNELLRTVELAAGDRSRDRLPIADPDLIAMSVSVDERRVTWIIERSLRGEISSDTSPPLVDLVVSATLAEPSLKALVQP